MEASFGGRCSARENILVSDAVHYKNRKIVASVQVDTHKRVYPHWAAIAAIEVIQEKSVLVRVVANNIFKEIRSFCRITANSPRDFSRSRS
jgi:hypothetical protein